MKIKSGIAIPMMAAMSARAKQAESIAEDDGARTERPRRPSPERSQPPRKECKQAQASSGEGGSR